MNFLEFLIELFWIISIDCILGFVLFVGYQFYKRKYDSKLAISLLEEENRYLKEENRKVDGTSINFWDRSE